MKSSTILCGLFLAGCSAIAAAGGIDGSAVIGGAIGGGAGAAVGSAVGGREGAIIGAGLGGAAGAAIATQPDSRPKTTARQQPVVVERETVYMHESGCWPPGHCKHHRHKHK